MAFFCLPARCFLSDRRFKLGQKKGINSDVERVLFGGFPFGLFSIFQRDVFRVMDVLKLIVPPAQQCQTAERILQQ